MTNSNQKASIYAIYFILSIIVFIICNASLHLPIASSLLITFTLIGIPSYNILKSLSDTFPLKKYLFGYVASFSAIAVAFSIAVGSL